MEGMEQRRRIWSYGSFNPIRIECQSCEIRFAKEPVTLVWFAVRHRFLCLSAQLGFERSIDSIKLLASQRGTFGLAACNVLSEKRSNRTQEYRKTTSSLNASSSTLVAASE